MIMKLKCQPSAQHDSVVSIIIILVSLSEVQQQHTDPGITRSFALINYNLHLITIPSHLIVKSFCASVNIFGCSDDKISGVRFRRNLNTCIVTNVIVMNTEIILQWA